MWRASRTRRNLMSTFVGASACVFVGGLMGGLLMLTGCGEAHQPTSQITAGLRVNTVLGEVDGDFAKAETPSEFVFPDDHGAHPRFRSEWWYVTAVLQDEHGAEFGMQFTLFRQALTPFPTGSGPWHTGQAYLAHLAVTDVESQSHEHAQRFARGHPAQAGVATAPFHAWIEDWDFRERSSSPWKVLLTAADDDVGVTLEFTQTQKPVFQGEAGLSHKGPGSASYYFSMPRLDTAGEVTINGRKRAVTGTAWLDREWSTSVLGDHLSGWNWFALQLDDGRSLMAFSLTRHDGEPDPYDHGVYLAAGADDGRHLQAGDYTLEPLRFWQASDGSAWPVRWRLGFSDGAPTQLAGQSWVVEALIDDQLMDVGLVYWEGLVGVRTEAGQKIGRGYMELTGYQDPVDAHSEDGVIEDEQ